MNLAQFCYYLGYYSLTHHYEYWLPLELANVQDFFDGLYLLNYVLITPLCSAGPDSQFQAFGYMLCMQQVAAGLVQD